MKQDKKKLATELECALFLVKVRGKNEIRHKAHQVVVFLEVGFAQCMQICSGFAVPQDARKVQFQLEIVLGMGKTGNSRKSPFKTWNFSRIVGSHVPSFKILECSKFSNIQNFQI